VPALLSDRSLDSPQDYSFELHEPLQGYPKLRSSSHGPKFRGERANRNSSILFHAEATDPDMLYFSRFNAFNPYLAFSVDGKRVGVTHAMKYGRMVKESALAEILLLSEIARVPQIAQGQGARPTPAGTPSGGGPRHSELQGWLPFPGGCKLISHAPYKWEIP